METGRDPGRSFRGFDVAAFAVAVDGGVDTSRDGAHGFGGFWVVRRGGAAGSRLGDMARNVCAQAEQGRERDARDFCVALCGGAAVGCLGTRRITLPLEQ